MIYIFLFVNVKVLHRPNKLLFDDGILLNLDTGPLEKAMLCRILLAEHCNFGGAVVHIPTFLLFLAHLRLLTHLQSFIDSR